jgi:tripartite-type tricarboxylate transporter receptor subunit TctC
VPYKGGGATVVAVLSGEATTAFNTLETVIGTLRSGRLRALAVSTRERSPAIPDVPTAAEAGVPDYEAIGWFGLFAPAGTPAAIVQQLSRDVAKAMASPGLRERALNEGAMPIGSTPAEFQRFVHAEIAKWTKIVKQAGIQLE